MISGSELGQVENSGGCDWRSSVIFSNVEDWRGGGIRFYPRASWRMIDGM